MFKRITQASSVAHYHTNVISHYESPLNVGAFSKKEKGVGGQQL